MSLLNDALQDIAMRESAQNITNEKSERDSNGRVPVQSLESSNKGFGFVFSKTLFCIAVLAVGGGVVYSSVDSEKGMSTHESREGDVPAEHFASTLHPFVNNDTNKPSTENEINHKNKSITPKSKLEPKSVKGELASSAERYSDAMSDSESKYLVYLKRASKAVDENRLSLPVNNNALYFLRMAKTIHNETYELTQLHYAVEQRYQYLIGEALNEKNVARAEQLINRTQSLGLSVNAKVYLKSLNVLHENQKISVSELNSDASKRLVKVAINESNAQTFRAILHSIDDLIEQQQYEAAEIIINKHLNGSPGQNHEVHQRFFHLYEKTQDFHAMKNLLKKVERPDQNFPYYVALQLNFFAGGSTAKEYLLQQHSESNSLPFEARALLAALHRQSGEYQESYGLYRRLVNEYSHYAGHWLGLAISADNLGKTREAYQAYTHSFDLGQHKPEVQAFIQDRISRLGEQLGETLKDQLAQSNTREVLTW